MTRRPREKTTTETGTAPVTGVNEVILLGRLTAAPQERELPSGDVICTFRLSVPRAGRTPMTSRSQQTTDWVDCVSAAARVRRTALGWQVGDQVEVAGALRRRFYRAAGQASTRLEVEATRARRVARA
ncbi:MAG: single-stranded DNA-binding protein [Oryzihumus sp.]